MLYGKCSKSGIVSKKNPDADVENSLKSVKRRVPTRTLRQQTGIRDELAAQGIKLLDTMMVSVDT